MSIIEELYYGNINPSEKYIKNGSEFQKLNKQLSEHIEEWLLLLNDDEKHIYENIEKTIFQLSEISEKERFFEGLYIGAQMAWEITRFKSDNYI